jgi:Type IV leader peptidase family.
MAEKVITGILYAAALIYAAVQDLKTHEIPDRAHIFLLLIATAALLYGGATLYRIENMAFGAVMAGGPLLIAACFSDGIGGGDVKLAAAAGLLLGLWYGIFALILSLIVFIIASLFCKIIKQLKHHAFAMAPAIAAGFTLTYLITIK